MGRSVSPVLGIVQCNIMLRRTNQQHAVAAGGRGLTLRAERDGFGAAGAWISATDPVY
jgi:hypothetical protein